MVSGRSLVLGEQLHSSGSLIYVPTTKAIEIYDVHTGAMVLSIGNPAGSLRGPDNLAISHAGNRIYLAQKSGVAVIDLPNAPLSIGSLTPAQGVAAGGTTVILRGSGFLSASAVTIDEKRAAVQFVDSTRLVLTTPSVTAAKDIVAVANPDGTTYSLDAAFDATAYAVPAPPARSHRRHTRTRRPVEHLRRRSQIFKFIHRSICRRRKKQYDPRQLQYLRLDSKRNSAILLFRTSQGDRLLLQSLYAPSSTGTVNLTMSTTRSSSASLNRKRHGEETLAVFLALSVCGMRRRRSFPHGLLVLLFSAMLLSLSACSAGSGRGGNGSNPSNPNAIPSGTYSITVTATSDSATRTTTVNVTVTSS